MEENQNSSAELTYNTVVLRQLDRIGNLTIQQIDFAKKEESLFIATMFLEAIVPFAFKQKQSYKDTIEGFKKSYIDKQPNIKIFNNVVQEIVSTLSPQWVSNKVSDVKMSNHIDFSKFDELVKEK